MEESRVTVFIGDVGDNLPPPSGVEEKEMEEIRARLNLKVDSQEASGKSLVPSELESFLMREFSEWKADAHWCPSPWQGADSDDGENTFFVVVHRTSRSGTMKNLHVKLTRRNREQQSWFKWPSFNYFGSSSSDEPKVKRVSLGDGNPREEGAVEQVEEEETTVLLTRELGRKHGQATAALRVGWQSIFQTVLPYLVLEEPSHVEYLIAFLEAYYHQRQDMEEWGVEFNQA